MTADHSAPIYGRPLEEGKHYRDRKGNVWKCTGVMDNGHVMTVQNVKTRWKDTVYRFGSVHKHCTDDLDIIEEYSPVTRWMADNHFFFSRQAAEGYAFRFGVEQIIELHEFKRHPVGGVK